MNKYPIIEGLTIDRFKPHEFNSIKKGDKWADESPFANDFYVDPNTVFLCQFLRNILGRKLTINSGYRSLRYNRSKGSKDTSQHTGNRACAVDLKAPTLLERNQIIFALGSFNAWLLEHPEVNIRPCTGIGSYSRKAGGFIHADQKKCKKMRWWYK